MEMVFLHGLLQGDTSDISIKFITILFLCRLLSLTRLLGKMQPAAFFALLASHGVSLGKLGPKSKCL